MAIRPPGVSRLRKSRSLSTGPASAAKGVHSEEGIEGAVEGRRQPLDGARNERHLSRADSGSVAFARLSQHRVGVIDSVDMSGSADLEAQFGDRQAGAE